MPLTALHVDERRIDSTDDEQWAEVHHPGYKGLVCPECAHGMYARKPPNMVRHFAHNPGYPRACSLTAAESAEHLRTKIFIAEAVRTLGWTAKIECPGDGWRADVLAISPSGQRRIAFEPQFATIHESTARERTQRHKASGIEATVWLDAKGQESLTELSRGRLFYDERDPRVGVQAFEGGRWGPRRLPLGVFVQRVCSAQLTYDGARWTSTSDQEAHARWIRKEEERRAEAERQAEARREWHRKHAEEEEARRQREAERRRAEQERIDREIAEHRKRREQEREQEQAERQAQWERDRPIREAEEREAQGRRKHEQAQREAEWRAAHPWTPENTMSDEELLALNKRYVDEPKPFPGWISAGEQLHVALGRRGLLHDGDARPEVVRREPVGPPCDECGRELLLVRPGRTTCAHCAPPRVLLP
jgi:hypothetical protein